MGDGCAGDHAGPRLRRCRPLRAPMAPDRRELILVLGLAGGFGGGEGGVVVGVVGDFLNVLGVNNFVVLVDDEDGAGFHAPFLDEGAEGGAEGTGFVVREHLDFVDAHGGAPAVLGEGEIHRDGVDGDVRELSGFVVEAFGLSVADGGVEGGDDAEDADAVAGGIEVDGFELVVDGVEVGGGVAGLQFRSDEGERIAFESSCSGTFHKIFSLARRVSCCDRLRRIHMMRKTMAWIEPVALAMLLGGVMVWSQAGDREQRFQAMSRDWEKKGLAEPFRGITAKGTVEPGLFTVKSTGVPTEPVRKAAVAFLASLTKEQKAKTLYVVTDDEWRKWMNQHFYRRQGVSWDEMNEAQRAAATAMMKASLSARGLKLSEDIRHLNETLGELNKNDFEQYGEGKYHLTVMGEPSAKEPWGWQIDGHHLIINYFVLGDQVVMTPHFYGSEPIRATAGKYKGTVIMMEEQDQGLALMRSLSEEQRKVATLEVSKTGNNNLTEAFKDNVVLDYAGILAKELTAKQKEALLALVQVYVGNMDEGHARVKMAEVKKHLDATRFAWIGGTADDSVFYYRIHSPVLLIEFDHQVPVGVRQLVANPRVPFRDHIHAVVRTPNGNDYGKDLLRQHYERSKH